VGSPDYLFEPDISSRIRRDFAAESEVVFERLLTFCRDYPDLAEPRIVRCIVHAAQGRLSGIEHYIAMAKMDPRDVILNAEYEMRSGIKRSRSICDRVHNFTRPFPE
jgi:hypothetical protein